MAKPRFLLVVFPAHGHVNPALQLARRLILIGCEVTFVTTVRAHRRMITKGGGKDDNNDNNFIPPNGMSFTQFSDGYDDGFGPKAVDFTVYSLELRSRGSQALIDLVDSSKNEGRPYTCMIYTFMMPWAADVAAKFGIPVALFWVQTATVFDLCYYYFHGYGDLIRDKMVNDRSCSLGFPGLPLDFAVRDLPSFLDASDSKLGSLIQFFQEQFDVIDQESQPKILVNTFDALEPEALRALCDNYKLNLIGIGPSINPVELRNSDDKNYKISKWLNSKPKGSVIYVSFGSIAVLTKPQMEEIAKGLLDFGRHFLWVIRENDNKNKDERGGEEEEKVSSKEELEKVGKIVPWCCQVEVLSNNALGCFVTHCGWNSTLESLVCGVPVVAFPQSVDQLTNAKLIEDFWKTGVKVKANEEGIVEGQEIKRCLEFVMGGEEMRRNAKKWKDLAWEASKDGGSSDNNLKAFVSDVTGLKTIS